MSRNLVVIVADTLRDPEPFREDGTSIMPFTDAFAASGMKFPHLMASSSWTAPSHVSLLSGANPWETHFHVRGAGPRAPRAESLADRWTKAGGVSAAFSANFLVAPALGTATGYSLYNPGFHAGLAGLAQLAVTFGGYERSLYNAMSRSMDPHSGPVARFWDHATRWGGTGIYKSINSMRSAETLMRSLARFLRQRARRAALPIHLFFNVAEPHEPYLVGQNGGPAGGPSGVGHVPSINFARFNDLLVSRVDPRVFVQAYRESMRAVDARFHDLVTMLRRSGVLQDAAVLFVSDHGQNLGEHRFYGHGFFLYDELVKVPGYLVEYRNGKPAPPASPFAEWIDHRHLFDLLSAYTPDGAEVNVPAVLSASLSRRGPAASYWEGPGPRPPDGVIVKARKLAPYRLVRIQRGPETALVRSDTKGGAVTPGPLETSDPISADLEDLGRRILTHDVMRTPPPTAGSAELDAQVDARLKSWGYD